MNCQQCGTDNPPGNAYCGRCGAPVAVPREVAVSPPVTQRLRVRGLTRSSREKRATHLRAKHEARGWQTLRYVDHGLSGGAFIEFGRGSAERRLPGWVWVGAGLAVVLGWVLLTAATRVGALVFGGVLVLASGWLLGSPKHRAAIVRVPRPVLTVATTAAIGLAGAGYAWLVMAADREAAQLKAEKQQQRLQEFEGEVAALEELAESDPASAYEGATRLMALVKDKADPSYAPFAERAKVLANQTRVPYAEWLLESARRDLAGHKYANAEVAAKKALELSPGLAAASKVRDQARRARAGVAKAAAAQRDALHEAAVLQAQLDQEGKRLAEARSQLAAAQDSIGRRSFIEAESLLDKALHVLQEIPRKSTIHANAVSTRKRIETMKERIKDKAARARRLLDRCGDAPKLQPWDGGLSAGEAYLEAGAHDPDSIDVEGCTVPVLTSRCWEVICKVRGKNAFGALVLNRYRFFVGRNPHVPSIGTVLSADQL